MIVLRLVPHALEAFLGIARRNLHGRADLPAGALDGPIRRGQPSIVGTQRARIAGVGDGAEDGDERLPVLLSVFLTPDAHKAAPTAESLGASSATSREDASSSNWAAGTTVSSAGSTREGAKSSATFSALRSALREGRSTVRTGSCAGVKPQLLLQRRHRSVGVADIDDGHDRRDEFEHRGRRLVNIGLVVEH